MESIFSKGMSDENRLRKLNALGLGSGVDMTDSKPWKKRGSYVVCRLTKMDHVVTFDEGGNWHTYENVVSSRTDMQSKVNLGIAVPETPIKLRADAEYSRSIHFSRKTYGRRLIDCRASISPDHIESVGEKAHDPFENRLSEWLVNKFKHHAKAAKVIESELEIENVEAITDRSFSNPRLMSLRLDEAEKKLVVAAHKQACSAPEEEITVEMLEWDLLVALCLRFIKRFRVTHFVHTLELGVLEYRLEEENKRSSTKGGGVGVDALLAGSAGANARINWEEFSNSKETTRIGIFDEKTKEIQRLAVVSVEAYPLTNLVACPRLRLALQVALNNYVDERHAEEESAYRRGPFMITFKDSDKVYYLKVAEKYVLGAGELEDATPLFLLNSSNTIEDEFYIVYYDEHMPCQNNGCSIVPNAEIKIPCYLEANPSLLGNNDGPLKFKPNADSGAANYRFKFEEPIGEDNNIRQIMEGEMSFYIRSPRKWKMASYVYFSRNQSTSSTFQSGCTHSKESHNQTTGFMLFQLQPFQPGDSPSMLPQPAKLPHP